MRPRSCCGPVPSGLAAGRIVRNLTSSNGRPPRRCDAGGTAPAHRRRSDRERDRSEQWCRDANATAPTSTSNSRFTDDRRRRRIFGCAHHQPGGDGERDERSCGHDQRFGSRRPHPADPCHPEGERELEPHEHRGLPDGRDKLACTRQPGHGPRHDEEAEHGQRGDQGAGPSGGAVDGGPHEHGVETADDEPVDPRPPGQLGTPQHQQDGNHTDDLIGLGHTDIQPECGRQRPARHHPRTCPGVDSRRSHERDRQRRSGGRPRP